MIKSISERPAQIEVDLLGPEGNAFVLIGKARAWAKQLGLDPKAIEQEMTSADYEHLVKTLEKHFGDFVVFYR
jgi:hypothetical protein